MPLKRVISERGDSLLRTSEEMEAIYQRQVDTVFRVCSLYLRQPADVEDAVQTAFLKLMESAGPFRDQEHEKAWLIVTASNVCKSFLRHWWRKTLDLDACQELAGAENVPADDTLACMQALPSKYKTVIYLYYYEGYRSREIAEILRKKESTIRNHLQEGRALLRNLLEEENDEEQ